MATAQELTEALVVEKLQETGLVAVQDLVQAFRPFLGDADPETKKANRERFRVIIHKVADVHMDESGVQRLCLKKPGGTPDEQDPADESSMSMIKDIANVTTSSTHTTTFHAHDESVLSAFVDMNPEEEATDLGFFSACRLRHALMPDLNASSTSANRLGNGQRKWLRAAAKGDVTAIRQMLKASPDVNCRDMFTGYTALHWAAKAGDVTLLAAICSSSKDVNVNARSNGGYTPLHLAALQGHEEAETHLIHFGADPNIVDFNGKKPAELRPQKATYEVDEVPPGMHPAAFRARANTAPASPRHSHGTIRVASKRLLKLFRTSSSHPEIQVEEQRPPMPTAASTGRLLDASGLDESSQTDAVDFTRENEPPKSPMIRRLTQLKGSLRRSKIKKEKRSSSLEELSLAGLTDSVRNLSTQDLTFTDSRC